MGGGGGGGGGGMVINVIFFKGIVISTIHFLSEFQVGEHIICMDS